MANNFKHIYYFPVSDQLTNEQVKVKLEEFRQDFLSQIVNVIVIPSYLGQEGLVAVPE